MPANFATCLGGRLLNELAVYQAEHLRGVTTYLQVAGADGFQVRDELV